MNPGQKKFKAFILERVNEDRVEEAKALLAESFKKQDERSFNQAYLKERFMPKMAGMLRPDAVEEVVEIMKDFGTKYRK